jgi:ATP-dependent protease ClpP protease subunit
MVKFIASILLLFSVEVSAATKFDLRIVGPINPDLRPAITLLKAHEGSKEVPVRIYLNSPGGRVDIMEELIWVIDSLKESGYTVNCVIDRAISAAFIISSSCDNRFAFADSVFMYHEIWMFYPKPLNLKKLKELIVELEDMQAFWDTFVRKHFKVSDEVFRYMKEREVFLSAAQMKKLSPEWITVWELKNGK